ncbi:MAG: rRNA (cytosine1402-N4)-methyltransferase [Clostridia bacterium]|nr:rRNA (cytosine1402-N4)-methyltransferase [Clostridia bacterium]
MEFRHQPVLLSEVINIMDPHPGEVFVDGTVGGGGHSLALIRRLLPGGRLICLDRDTEAIEAARKALSPFFPSVTLIQAEFGQLPSLLPELGLEGIDGLLLDLGVSSFQLENPRRGFSYQWTGPLDMRMDPRGDLTAADIVNTWEQEELARIIWEYGEERWAGRIAAFICAARRRKRLETTTELVEVIKAAIPAGARKVGHHPAKKTFQALRIALNDELGQLRRVLLSLEKILKPGGRVGVISFHSLEDRIVKQIFKRLAGQCTCPPGLPVCSCGRRKILEPVNRKPILPSAEEQEANPRSRSAKLRVARRVLTDKEGE